jgi:UDP-N-acetylglucosamine:LPS N-acetylglucosamine transferase
MPSAATLPAHSRPGNRGGARLARLPRRRRTATPPAPCSGADSGARIVIVSAGIGGGHNACADEFGRRLRASGFTVDTCDFLDQFPGRAGALLRRVYAGQLSVLPASWGVLCTLLRARPVCWLVAVLCTLLTGPALRRRTAGAAAALSTYPLATLVLGRLRRRGRLIRPRRRGRLAAPVLTYLTDVAVHPLWMERGCDCYLAAHRITAEQITALGARQVRRVDAAVRSQFRSGTQPSRAAARRRFGLPPTGRFALVAGGAWAVGDVARTAREIAATGAAVPVVVCATNEALRAELSAAGVGVALGWVDEMATLMRACDAVVTNGGGITSVEATELGVPVLIHRPLPGHGRANAEAFDAAGLAYWVREVAELAAALHEPHRPATEPAKADPATVVAELAAAAAPASALRPIA